ncbi:TPA: glycosyltransferase, partial [Streptococcus suis]
MAIITVCVPVYNSSSFLKDCLESIRNQTFSDLEIICV